MVIFRHRLFTDEHFWIGKDPDFNLPWNGSVLAIPSHVQRREHIHPAVIQGVPITFIAKLSESVGVHEYLISLEYDIGGTSHELSASDIDARITCHLSEVSFVIYTIPAKPTATGSTHRLFFWIRTHGVCQRLWKTDTFHVTGLTLPNDFRTDNLILATPDMRNPIQVEMIQEDEPTTAMPVEIQPPLSTRSNNPFTALSRSASPAASTLPPNSSTSLYSTEKSIYAHEQGEKVPTFNQESRNHARPLDPINVSMVLTTSGAVPEADDDPVPSYQASSNHSYRPSLWAHSTHSFPGCGGCHAS
ncbi:hypothetical protein BS47DRAFT_1348992 [Hydnum rufescens UP504]|uniref:Uncharacterized protein n=1 Tax=Hydnum rufescens UP504 TaxID=1448309 RepID=A0A9P6APE7_9AGAM|nr:hypothetical protein BS47DRAFT_1348992 [Hydnum rufescens UP504]